MTKSDVAYPSIEIEIMPIVLCKALNFHLSRPLLCIGTIMTWYKAECACRNLWEGHFEAIWSWTQRENWKWVTIPLFGTFLTCLYIKNNLKSITWIAQDSLFPHEFPLCLASCINALFASSSLQSRKKWMDDYSIAQKRVAKFRRIDKPEIKRLAEVKL